MDFPDSMIPRNLEDAFRESLIYLGSQAAIDSLAADAYWPKWHSPWWHISLLFEMGLTDWIPDGILDKVIEQMNVQYLRFFPQREEDLPAGVNPNTQIACHCQLGNIYQILKTKGIDVDARLPWIRPWFLIYQLPDGGLNCDEGAYLHSHKSSVVSSLPVFEALLLCADTGSLTAEETVFLDQAVQYLVRHCLVYRTNGDLMDPDFLTLQFPRFYHYDILRGLAFLNRWRDHYPGSSPLGDSVDQIIREAVQVIQTKLNNDLLLIERCELNETTTLALGEGGNWRTGQPVSFFPLLTLASTVGTCSPNLTGAFQKVLESLEKRDHAR